MFATVDAPLLVYIVMDLSKTLQTFFEDSDFRGAIPPDPARRFMLAPTLQVLLTSTLDVCFQACGLFHSIVLILESPGRGIEETLTFKGGVFATRGSSQDTNIPA